MDNGSNDCQLNCTVYLFMSYTAMIKLAMVWIGL